MGSALELHLIITGPSLIMASLHRLEYSKSTRAKCHGPICKVKTAATNQPYVNYTCFSRACL
ncbi:hypothetical protein C8R41DRAFT_819343 [Lentinula lateritia]|uniref:Uncharacterized protein n=1 Tax=Lentinula lateritia TaxID=40482 RepID=A0ABQ8VNZ4_9AGAR|nr:hypothetical protein C8R41DRAFT_819343 [Lentinula lateritia]